jgi:hypothetical protein
MGQDEHGLGGVLVAWLRAKITVTPIAQRLAMGTRGHLVLPARSAPYRRGRGVRVSVQTRLASALGQHAPPQVMVWPLTHGLRGILALLVEWT